jgi:hypothetical protein
MCGMDAAERRAAERRKRATEWPVRCYRLGEEPNRDPLDLSTIDERIGMVWPLSKEGWAVAGRQIPNYERSSMPGQIVRRER